MSDTTDKTADPMAAFQKMWTDSLSKMMQTAFTFGPDSAPPEVLRQLRSGMFQALAQSWEEFMRSPQFLEGMKQWMDNAINFRKMSNDFMAKVRSEFQAPSRDDVDNVLLSVRHMEKRLLDRLEELAGEIGQLKAQQVGGQPRKTTAKPAAPKRGQSRTVRKSARRTA